MICITTEIPRLNGTAKGLVEAREGDQLVHSDRIDLTSATSRKRFSNAVAGKLESPDSAADVERLLLARLEELRALPEEAPAKQTDQTARLLAEMPAAVRREADSFLADPYLFRQLVEDVEAAGVAGERSLTATLYLIGVSRLLPRPLAGIVQGHTSSGKSFTIDRVVSLFPPETVIVAQQLTPQALFHMPPGSLRHRWIVAGERSRREEDDAAEATRALREMLSAGHLAKLIPMKDEHGQIITQRIEQEGPIAYVETTTLSRIFDEDLNRCLLLTTDEREDQTRRILESLADSRSGSSPDPAPIVARHHAVQRMLTADRAEVSIPYAGRLAELFPAQRPEARRAFGHTLSLIEASALLHCRQRERDAQGQIVAAHDDYAIARELLAIPLARTLGGGISDGAKRLHERLAAWVQGRFTSSEAYRHENYSERQVRGWLTELNHAGWANLIDSGRGRTSIWELVAEAEATEPSALPSTHDVCSGIPASALPTEVNS